MKIGLCPVKLDVFNRDNFKLLLFLFDNLIDICLRWNLISPRLILILPIIGLVSDLYAILSLRFRRNLLSSPHEPAILTSINVDISRCDVCLGNGRIAVSTKLVE